MLSHNILNNQNALGALSFHDLRFGSLPCLSSLTTTMSVLFFCNRIRHTAFLTTRRTPACSSYAQLFYYVSSFVQASIFSAYLNQQPIRDSTHSTTQCQLIEQYFDRAVFMVIINNMNQKLLMRSLLHAIK